MKQLIFLFLICATTFGQIKIGDITIPDSIAQEYLLYCYKIPDTVWIYTNNWTIEDSIKSEKREVEFQQKLNQAKTYKDSLSVHDAYFIMVNNLDYASSRYVGDEETKLQKKSIGRVYKIERNNNERKEYVGYVIKRELTVTDFTKWYLKQKGLIK